MSGFRPGRSGVAARVVAASALTAAVLSLPLLLESTQDLWLGLAAIYAIIGLSVNIVTGHAGQISLGHQAFVGIGAFMAAFVVKSTGGFPVDPVTGLVTAPPRPAAFASNQAYAYVCLAVLAVFLFVDWRLSRTRAGRAMVALRNEEQV